MEGITRNRNTYQTTQFQLMADWHECQFPSLTKVKHVIHKLMLELKLYNKRRQQQKLYTI